MPRLINANELVSLMKYYDEQQRTDIWETSEIEHLIGEIPTVQTVEMVHGRWEDFCRGKMCCCSVCKAEFDNTCNEIHGEWFYCPNCGADMRGDGNG